MKKSESFYMSKDIIAEIKRQSKIDRRSKSDWLDLFLRVHIMPDEEIKESKQMASSSMKAPKKSKFKPPLSSDVALFATFENLNLIGFFDYYESNGWKVGRNTMKDWRAAARGWSKRQSNFNKANSNQQDFSDDSTGWVNKDYGLL